jgi:hypothetical protein
MRCSHEINIGFTIGKMIAYEHYHLPSVDIEQG